MIRQRVDGTEYFTKDGFHMTTYYRVLCMEDSEIPSDWQPSTYASSEIDFAAPKFKDFVRRSFYMNEILYASPPAGATTVQVDASNVVEQYQWVDENRFVHEMCTCVDSCVEEFVPEEYDDELS